MFLHKSFNSLTLTLAFAFSALSLFVLFMASGFELFFMLRAQQEVVNNQQQLVAQNAATQVSSYIQQKFNVLDQAADINNLATSPSRRELTAGKLIGRDPSFRQVFLLDKTGKDIFRFSRLALSQLEIPQDMIPALVERILENKRHISPIYIDKSTNEPLVLIAVPAKDQFRDVVGAFVAEVNLKFMWDLVENIDVGGSGETYVVDEDGDLIAFADIGRVLARENVANVSEVAQFVGDAPEPRWGISKGITGANVVSSHVGLGTPDWAVVVEVPVVEVYASVLQVLNYALLICVFGVGIAIVLGVYIARRITRPLVELNQAAQRISHGDLDVRTNMHVSNELGQLAASFDDMAQKLKGVYGHLEEKVGEKTTELARQITEVERSKSAILNLLEDIEGEKQKAEQTVQLRTKELQEEKARLLASINSLSFGFILADEEHRIVLTNPVTAQILELDHEPETIHDISSALKHTESGRKVDLTIQGTRCMELREPAEFKEVTYGRKSLHVICAPIASETVSFGYILIIEDITEAKVMERSRDEFFAVASHELRTPLTAIRGNTEMILEMYGDQIRDKDMQEMLQDINSASVRLIEIVNDFLEVSRLEQGRIEIHKEEFDMRTLVERVIRDLRGTIEKHGIALVFEPPEELPLIVNDRNRIEQILVNLIGNSAKFTKHGTITVRIERHETFLKVVVADTGIGISEENQALLFRKFQQAGEKMLARDVTQGTGLGLYICKLLMGLMGGDVVLMKSELGKGSTFAFTVPLKP